MRRAPADKPGEYRSSISGVMSGDSWDTRQECLKEIKEVMEMSKKAVFLDIVPEPTNPYDRDALQLFFNSPTFGRTQIGYVKNAQTLCDFCGMDFERYPTSGKCKRCGHGEEDLKRNGLASKIAKELRADPTCHFYAQVIQVTGGIGQKNLGCNIIIRRVNTPLEKKPWE